MLNKDTPNSMSNNEINEYTTDCESKVLDSSTLNECNNKHFIPMGGTGPLVAKIPVILSDLEVQIDVESEIKLQEPALDIKTVDKKVNLTQCKLIPYTNKLFIAGYVQKNIQYSTIHYVNESSASGNIRHITVKVPFKCVTKIKLVKKPIYGKEYKKRISSLDKSMFCEDGKEDSWIHYSKPYEAIYCELDYARILETDFLKDLSSHESKLYAENGIFEVIEKMVIFIRLKVLQNQQVCIPEPEGDVVIVKKHSSDLKKDSHENKDKKHVKIEVGFDGDKGMIGREVPREGHIED